MSIFSAHNRFYWMCWTDSCVKVVHSTFITLCRLTAAVMVVRLLQSVWMAENYAQWSTALSWLLSWAAHDEDCIMSYSVISNPCSLLILLLIPKRNCSSTKMTRDQRIWGQTSALRDCFWVQPAPTQCCSWTQPLTSTESNTKVQFTCRVKMSSHYYNFIPV